jgi:photosystem II stability/assembly factor-like uncharacterized protein
MVGMRNWGIGLVVVLVGVGGAAVGRSHGSGAAGASASPLLPAVPAPTSTTVPTPPVRQDAGELRFLDGRLGWAPVSTSCGQGTCIVVFASEDGGQTWTARSNPLSVESNEDRRVLAAPMVRLNSRDLGWLVDIDGNLYSTTDGARTWRPERTQHPIVSLETAGETVWRLEQACPWSTGQCRDTLLTSNDRGVHWVVADPQPPIGRSGMSSLTPAMVSPSPDVAYIFSDAGEHPGDPAPREWNPDPLIARTADRGRTWTAVKPPCPAREEGGAWGADLAASTPDDVWLVCDDTAGSGAMEPKHLHRSSDGGQHWSEDLRTPNAGNGGRTAAASPLRACRGGSRTSISCTRDGGRSLFFPVPKGADNPFDGGVEVYQLTDGGDGWAVGQDANSGNQDVVRRTTDGGETWSPSRITS